MSARALLPNEFEKPTAMPLRETHITLSHGGGGRAMRDLVQDVFTSVFRPPGTDDQARLTDAALSEPGARLAFTTDSYVVTPLEFPGGNIGKLAVCGTVNDLAVGGARPLWLSAAFVIEEGCEVALLRRIAATMAEEATRAGVRIVTGDTKVVGRGKGDGIFITTSGIGVIPPGIDIGAAHIRPGDAVLVNGVLGDHGATILAARGDLAILTDIQSDCAGLGHLMQAVLAAAPGISAARDCTRGGLAAVLNELAAEAGLSFEIAEDCIPLRSEVAGLCELLGLDPIYLANEGRLVLFCPPDQAVAALAAMRALPEGRDACHIGHVYAGLPGRVTLRTRFGGARMIDMPVGDQLPRIC